MPWCFQIFFVNISVLNCDVLLLFLQQCEGEEKLEDCGQVKLNNTQLVVLHSSAALLHLPLVNLH